MANPKGNVESLKPYEGKWQSGKTQTIRVPIALTEQILAYARALDASDSPVTEDDSSIDLAELKAKVEAKEPGFRANSASKLISALKVIFDKL